METFLFGDENADIYLVQPVDDHDMGFIQKEYDLIARHFPEKRILLAAVHVDSWNKDLSPWEAPPVFGDEPFGNGAGETLRFITELMAGTKEGVPVIVGGYSLAGLFALWAVYQTDIFSGCVAASPSVWFPEWIGYAESHAIKTENVYLSLGMKESKTKNPVMRSVGECIKKQDMMLEGKRHILEWNEGNHFAEPEVRTARGFVWAVEEVGR